jgi:cytochrome P450
MASALRGNALAAFPPEAFETDVVVQSFFGRHHILLQSPDAIHHVLVANPGNYTRAKAVRRVLRPMFGRGLFLSHGEEWRRQRHAVAPAFAPRLTPLLAPRIVAAAEKLKADLTALNGIPVDLRPYLQETALSIIGGAIFSLDMARHGKEVRRLIIDYATRLSRPSVADYLLPLSVPTFADLARARFRRRWRRMIAAIIEERSTRPRGPEPSDLFDVLAASDPETGIPPDAEMLCDQIATIVVAGHETTAAALFWALYLLARHPDIQDRVAAEVKTVSPAQQNAAAALAHLTYTRAVVDEVLRLYPPAYVIVREAQGDDVAAGVAIPQGSLVLISPWVLHRHCRLWAAPQRFDPERFLPGAPPPPRFAYIPFGAGPRICVGAPFALTELVLLIAVLVGAFDVRLASREPIEPQGLVTLQPAAAAPFLLTPRVSRGNADTGCRQGADGREIILHPEPTSACPFSSPHRTPTERAGRPISSWSTAGE